MAPEMDDGESMSCHSHALIRRRNGDYLRPCAGEAQLTMEQEMEMISDTIDAVHLYALELLL